MNISGAFLIILILLLSTCLACAPHNVCSCVCGRARSTALHAHPLMPFSVMSYQPRNSHVLQRVQHTRTGLKYSVGWGKSSLGDGTEPKGNIPESGVEGTVPIADVVPWWEQEREGNTGKSSDVEGREPKFASHQCVVGKLISVRGPDAPYFWSRD